MYFLTIVITIGDNNTTPIKLGIAISPLKVSAIAQTDFKSEVAQITIIIINIILYDIITILFLLVK